MRNEERHEVSVPYADSPKSILTRLERSTEVKGQGCGQRQDDWTWQPQAGCIRKCQRRRRLNRPLHGRPLRTLWHLHMINFGSSASVQLMLDLICDADLMLEPKCETKSWIIRANGFHLIHLITWCGNDSGVTLCGIRTVC